MFAALKRESFRVEEVADSYGISHHHVAKVVNHLAQLGYLETRRGRGGGIQLIRPATEIRIGKLVRETEDQPVIVECFDAKTNTCPISGSCRLKAALAEAIGSFYATLDEHTLAEIVSGTAGASMSQVLLPEVRPPSG